MPLSVIKYSQENKMIIREGDVDGMKGESNEYLQCCNCGHVHKQPVQCNNDDLYINDIQCEVCRRTVKHLRCGENLSDVYMYYDVVLDRRFY
jgi:hypothetical protein